MLTRLTRTMPASPALVLILAPAGAVHAAPSCASEIGQAAAQKLADQCRDASPATRPPCNPVNPCAMMREEIRRSCDLFKDSSPLPPKLCAAGATP